MMNAWKSFNQNGIFGFRRWKLMQMMGKFEACCGKFESSAGIKAKRKLRETHYFEQNMFAMEDFKNKTFKEENFE
jgi:hypothetical protein